MPQRLKKGSWIIVYDSRNYNFANNVLEQFQGASRQLGMNVEEPEWIELDNFNRTEQFERELTNYIRSKQEPSIVVIIIPLERLYKAYKNICYQHNVISQVVALKTARGMNMSVASNVLKQINSKLGGDLFNLQFAKDISMAKTMLIGLDVCHAGRESIVGFCASVNKNMSQYYSEKINQKRGQEIVDQKLKDALKRAIACFMDRNDERPEHFIVYRDGVGDAMRRQVLQQEISQLK